MPMVAGAAIGTAGEGGDTQASGRGTSDARWREDLLIVQRALAFLLLAAVRGNAWLACGASRQYSPTPVMADSPAASSSVANDPPVNRQSLPHRVNR